MSSTSSVDDATLHAVRNHIDTALATPPPPMGSEDTREPFTVRPANSAWGQGGYPFLDEYLGILAENYGAGLRLLDYVGDPEGSRAIINGWVEDATEDRIKDLIPEGAITVDTRLALVNAIWFYANWFDPFDPALTAPGTFTLLDGSEVQVPMMHANRRNAYAATDRFDAVRLSYAGDAAMVVLLPKDGSPAELAARLTPQDLDIPWSDFIVDITLPSFEFEAEVGLSDALKAARHDRRRSRHRSGDGADLTGITAIARALRLRRLPQDVHQHWTRRAPRRRRLRPSSSRSSRHHRRPRSVPTVPSCSTSSTPPPVKCSSSAR